MTTPGGNNFFPTWILCSFGISDCINTRSNSSGLTTFVFTLASRILTLPPCLTETPPEFTPAQYPPFPPGLPTVTLEMISLAKLLQKDATEQDRIFECCKGRGFFYLELVGTAAGETILKGSEHIARAGEETFRLPLDEKMTYRLGKSLFGYKAVGVTVTDKKGTRDTAEFFNVAKNDMIVPDENMSRAWPAPILAQKKLFTDYVRSAHGIGMLIMECLASKLGLDPAEFERRHRLERASGDHVRITRGPPRESEEMPEIQTPSHTDFGT
jgi:isopenicillin N synthase-like dioxygenase